MKNEKQNSLEEKNNFYRLETIMSCFKFVPFWKKWRYAGEFSSYEAAEKAVGSERELKTLKRVTRKDGAKRITFEVLPNWHCNEKFILKNEYDGFSIINKWEYIQKNNSARNYLHVRIIPICNKRDLREEDNEI